MNNEEMIRELRSLTQAGMKDCLDALKESGWDVQGAVDIVKKKGLNVVSGREGKVAAEGIVAMEPNEPGHHFDMCMVEINCQTDFVANSPEFKEFAQATALEIWSDFHDEIPFTVDKVESSRQALVSSTKENVVVRRWWVEQAAHPNARVFSYVHSNNKIGVMLTILAPSDSVLDDPEFIDLGNDLAMQVAAMSPLAVSPERLSPDVVMRQRLIFEAQLAELKKPPGAWDKILEGKFNKWYSEVCLMNQESVVLPKTTIQQVVKNLGTKINL